MSTLVIKTGMASELALAKQMFDPSIMVLSGVQDVAGLEKLVPADCRGIVSFGLCGGLSPTLGIGVVVICDKLVSPDGTWQADAGWSTKLMTASHEYSYSWWSSGQFNTADTEAEREALFKHTGCAVIDDETYAVAAFATKHGLPFQAMRSISDGAEDNLPPAVVNALNPDGSDNVMNIVKSVATDPLQIPALVKTAIEYEMSMRTLKQAAQLVGSNFQFPPTP